MNIYDCELLLILLEEENITKTSERLFTSQSTNSYRIKTLEKELNCTLFERSKTGIIPTKECRIVEAFARDAMHKYKDLHVKLAESQAVVDRNEKIQLGASSIIASRFFSSFLKSFRSTYPYAEVSLRANTSRNIYNMLEKGSLDAGILRSSNDFEWDGKMTSLHEEAVCLVSSRPVDAESLADQPFISLPRSCTNDIACQWLLERFGQLPKKTIEVNSIEICLQLVDEDFGFCILPAVSIFGRKKYYGEELKWLNGQPLQQKTMLLCQKNCRSFVSENFFDFVVATLPKAMDTAISDLKFKTS